MTEQRTVDLWRKPHVVSVYQQSKTIWIAVGDYMNERIEVKGRTKSDAVAQWRRAAEYKGN